MKIAEWMSLGATRLGICSKVLLQCR